VLRAHSSGTVSSKQTELTVEDVLAADAWARKQTATDPKDLPG
jgi:hypothetical protein